MPRRPLSPALLATLGLSACVDGCEASDLPIVGDLFEDDEGDDDRVGPCLEMMPCLTTDAGPAVCLDVALPEPVAAPVPVGPCLQLALPIPEPPAPEPIQRPCLDFVAPSPPPAPPPPAPEDRGGAIPVSRPEVVASLVADGTLAEDVASRLRWQG